MRLYLTVLATLAELAHLTWEHYHGGVLTHHVLHRPDLPAISNWWGALLIPALAFFLSGRIDKRAPSYAAFFGSMLFGALLSAAFVSGHDAILSYMFLGVSVIALVLPIYRAENVLGFVLGMTFTFGAVLPTAVGSVVAMLSAASHRLVRHTFARRRAQ
jgi:hypothetical protein